MARNTRLIAYNPNTMTNQITDNVKTHSRPSDLRITDVRAAALQLTPRGWKCPLVRIDTNQGINGIGEVRDGASKNYALMLKRLLVGENPCNVDKLFRKIKQFGGHARQGGGVCGVEMALMDLAGKAYGVPAYVLAGGKFRDTIRMYCDTPNEPTGEAMGQKLKKRMERGFTILKMDVGIQPLIDVKDALAWPAGMLGELTGEGDSTPARAPHHHAPLHPRAPDRPGHRADLRVCRSRCAASWAMRCRSRPTTSATSAWMTACGWARRWSRTTWPGWKIWCRGSSPTSGCNWSAR